jgi:DNA-directed RNA polymerase subunit H (RpoH/RPB5)
MYMSSGKVLAHVHVVFTEEEKELLEKLAAYLHKLGKIEAPTISDALRVCLHFTVNEILKAVEAERYRG